LQQTLYKTAAVLCGLTEMSRLDDDDYDADKTAATGAETL